MPIELEKWFETDIINKKREYIKDIIRKKSFEKVKIIKKECKEEVVVATDAAAATATAAVVESEPKLELSIRQNGHSLKNLNPDKQINEFETKAKIKKLKNETNFQQNIDTSQVI